MLVVCCIPLLEVHSSNTEPRYSSGTIIVAFIQGSSIDSCLLLDQAYQLDYVIEL